ncbi:PDZ domain-containing protein 8 [Blattella germanica]|nr:PDZ domain-containing protein 8 [Blattella germanica]
MSIAKSTGKELYSNLSPPERKDKINKMISKLKAAIDTETQLRMQLAQKEQESKDPSEHTRIAFLIGKSDEKVQALAVLMLHFCAGLQHTQDQEEASKVSSYFYEYVFSIF